IIKTIHRSLAERDEERALGSYVLHHGTTPESVIGRVIGKRLDDELGDRIGVVVDGVDGRVHHVALSEAASAEPPAVGSIVQVGSASTGSRRSDHN
ncbi:DUF3363 domain-containing protein, partial [Acinetobacter baumannii]